MPAQIGLPFKQLERIYTEARKAGEVAVILFEGAGAYAPSTVVLDVWVLDDESVNSDTHRSILVDQEGNILGDHVEHDDE